MKKIKLTQGQYALVDNEDFEYLNQWKWCAQKTIIGKFYAVRNSYVNKKRIRIQMHRIILGVIPKGKEVDHKDSNGLNNQRSNLRFATRQENMRNKKLNLNNISGFKGVHWRKDIKKWVARSCLNKKIQHLGYFINKLDAKQAYDKFAKENFKEFYRLN